MGLINSWDDQAGQVGQVPLSLLSLYMGISSSKKSRASGAEPSASEAAQYHTDTDDDTSVRPCSYTELRAHS